MVSLRKATDADLTDIVRLLSSSGLPVADYDLKKVVAIVATVDDSLVGHVGVEVYDDVALLRSLVVDTPHRGQGVAGRLVDEIVGHLPDFVDQVFLLTETAAGFFSANGFVERDRDHVPASIAATTEFAELCPTSAIVMGKNV